MINDVSKSGVSHSVDFGLFEATPGMRLVYLPDAPRFTIIAASKDICQHLGFPKDHFVGKGVFEAFPSNPSDPSDMGETALHASLTHVVWYKEPHELPIQRYDVKEETDRFSRHYWKAANFPFLNDKGEVVYIIHTTEDITDQVETGEREEAHQQLQRAYQKLEESEKKYRNLFESIDQGFCLVELLYDESGKPVDHLILETNPVFETQTGLKNVVGKTASEVAPDIETRWFHLYDNVIQSGKSTRFTEESSALNRWFDVYVYPAGDRDNKRVAVLFTDITERKRMELALKENETQLQGKVEERTSELQEKNIELRRSNTNLEEFAYAASHDMKEPIRKIHFFADRLKVRLANKLEDEDLRYFERLETGVKRITTLIDDLLLYSHVNRGVSSIETVDLNQMLSFVLDDLELHIEEKGAKVEMGPLPTIQGRPRQLQQLFENLIANAIKYSKPDVASIISVSSRLTKGSEVLVQTSFVNKDNFYYLIQVTDNGIGFEQVDAERIFNLFTRLHGNAEYRGTGVGLSIVQKIVENHNGYIWAESKPGEGSIFFVLFPMD